MSTGDHVAVDTHDHVAVVTLDRPEALNAISGSVATSLGEAFSSVAGDEDVWVAVLRASGTKAFCVGADLKERAEFSLDDYRANRKLVAGMFEALRAIPQPTIAAVFGFALGGGFELALACDLVVAAEGTELGLPEATVGLLAAGGGTQLLARSIGETRAKELIFTGRRLDAAEAKDLGLVTEVVERAELDATATRLAARLCESSPVALRSAKAAIGAALGPLEAGIRREDEEWAKVIASADRREGIEAFNDKRPPRWSNR